MSKLHNWLWLEKWLWSLLYVTGYCTKGRLWALAVVWDLSFSLLGMNVR